MINYDSDGFSTGLAMSNLLAEMQYKFITNRSKLFLDSMSTAGFKQSAMSRFNEYKSSNFRIMTDTLTEAKSLINYAINKAYNSGSKSVDDAVAEYKKQGLEVEEVKEKKSAVLNTRLLKSIANITAIVYLSGVSAGSQYQAIVNQVNENVEDLAKEIDRIQAVYLHSGMQTSNIDVSSDGERSIRNDSHEMELEAQSERSEEYGLKPLVQISSHPSSCQLCVPWQGQILVDDVYQNGKANEKYELLSVAIDSGLFHWNCRHQKIPFVEGLDNADIYKRNADTPERTALRYTLEQKQRNNERLIREEKRILVGSLDETNQGVAKQRVLELQEKQRNLLKMADQFGVTLYRQYEREQIGGQTTPIKRN